ncbi:MAG: type III-A CRISPR-associated RAMP protein Csm5 [bacterium]
MSVTKMILADSIKERKRLRLQVISPVHIGTREGKLIALEFAAYGGKVYIIDENQFGSFLKRRNLIDYFVHDVSNGRLQMQAFLKNTAKADLSTVLPEISSQIIPSGSTDMANMNEFRPCIRDANGQIFLPGTSLKGVFRTALLYRMLTQGDNKQLAASIQQKADSGLDGRLSDYQKKHYSSKWLQEDLLQKFLLPKGKPGSYEDILRCLTVRDAYPEGELETQVIKLKFLSKGANGKHYFSQQKDGIGQPIGKDLELWVEAITAGTFSLELTWDHTLYAKFKDHTPNLPLKDLQDLINAVDQFNNALLGNEEGFFRTVQPIVPKHITAKNFSRLSFSISQASQSAQSIGQWYKTHKDTMLRVGFGSGLLSTTVALAFNEETRRKIRNACGHPRGNDPAPKSRRVWQKTDSQWLPMGWMTMKAEEEQK